MIYNATNLQFWRVYTTRTHFWTYWGCLYVYDLVYHIHWGGGMIKYMSDGIECKGGAEPSAFPIPCTKWWTYWVQFTENCGSLPLAEQACLESNSGLKRKVVPKTRCSMGFPHGFSLHLPAVADWDAEFELAAVISSHIKPYPING